MTNSTAKVREIVQAYTDHANVEIQQRACEYIQILTNEWDDERGGIFEPILFQGTENMLVDNAASRAIGGNDDEEEEPVQ